jgi:hypothetical protein
MQTTTVVDAIVTLPEILRAERLRRKEEERKKREETARYCRALQRRKPACERRFEDFIIGNKDRRDFMGAETLARTLSLDVSDLLLVTKGIPCRMDFGRYPNGKVLTIFFTRDFVRWAREQRRDAN